MKLPIACKSAVYSNESFPYCVLSLVRFGISGKSNQIKSYFPISHIPYDGEFFLDFPEFE